MADGKKGIRRLIELVLDRKSVQRLEKDTQTALKKGTDPKKAKKNLSAIETGMARIKSAALKLGGVLAVAFGVRAVIRFGKESVRIATEAEAIWNRLGQAVENTGKSFADARPEIDETARALQDVTTVGDEDFAMVMTELLTTSNDYEESLRNVSLVADMAAAKQMDLRTSAQLVGRVMVGETGTLSRYGIVVQEGANAMEVLRDRFQGFAENEARSLQGRLKQLSNEWGDFRQAVGDAMIAAGGGTSVIETLTATVKSMTEWVNANRVTFQRWGEAFIDLLERMGGAIQRKLDQLDPLGKQERDHMTEILRISEDQLALDGKRFQLGQQILRLDEKRREEVAETNRLQALADAGRTTPLLARQSRYRAAQIEKEIQSLQALIRTIDELGEKTTPSSSPTPSPSSSPTPSSTEPSAEPSKEEQLQALWGEHGGAMAAAQAHSEWIDRQKSAWERLNSEMTVSEENAAKIERGMERMSAAARASQEEIDRLGQTMAWAFENGFASVFAGLESMEDAAKGIGFSLILGLTEGQAEYHFAQAAGKLAEGLWPPNPAALASAAKHVMAGGLFSALRGLARAGGIGGGGSSSSGGLARGGSSAITDSSTTEKLGPEVHIYFDGEGWNAMNPRVQSVVYNAQQYAEERFGENATVKTHRRTR